MLKGEEELGKLLRMIGEGRVVRVVLGSGTGCEGVEKRLMKVRVRMNIIRTAIKIRVFLLGIKRLVI